MLPARTATLAAAMQDKTLYASLAMLVLLALIWSGVAPYDRATWLLEVAPVLIAGPLLLWSYPRFPLTRLLYWVIAIHSLILILGGTYTYARVPAGFWVQDWFELSRNPYDKLGHFIQGVTPALLAREILLRLRIVAPGKMLGLLSLCVALAFSAFYELIEWWVALLAGQGAEDFLGTQGDPWDTQSDMFMALLGALISVSWLSRAQDRQIARLTRSTEVALP
jgi:putative membrane protein